MKGLILKFLICMFICLQLGLTSFATSTQDNVDYYIAEGNDYYVKGALSEALESYSRAEKLDSNSFIAIYNQGLINMEMKNYQEAKNKFIKVLSINENSVSAYYELGLAYEKLNDSENANANYNNATKLQPKSALAYFNRGNAYSKLGKADLANKDYISAAKLDSKYSEYVKIPKKNVQENDDLQNKEQNQNEIMDYIRYNYKSLLIILTALIMLININIIFYKRYRFDKKNITHNIIDYIQNDLEMDTFNESDESLDSWYPATKELLKTWDEEKVKRVKEKLLLDFPDYLNYNYLIDALHLLDERICENNY